MPGHGSRMVERVVLFNPALEHPGRGTTRRSTLRPTGTLWVTGPRSGPHLGEAQGFMVTMRGQQAAAASQAPRTGNRRISARTLQTLREVARVRRGEPSGLRRFTDAVGLSSLSRSAANRRLSQNLLAGNASTSKMCRSGRFTGGGSGGPLPGSRALGSSKRNRWLPLNRIIEPRPRTDRVRPPRRPGGPRGGARSGSRVPRGGSVGDGAG